MKECTCGCTTFKVDVSRYPEVPDFYTCRSCGKEYGKNDDGHLYDPSDPPGPLWSLSLHDCV